MANIFEEIQKTIDQNDVVLFMKGSKDFPQCGFSATVSHILNTLGVGFQGRMAGFGFSETARIENQKDEI